MELANAFNVPRATSVDMPSTMGLGFPVEVVRDDHPADQTIRVIARHVSEEGCLFLLSGSDLTPGESLLVNVATLPPVRGVVRWVQKDRLGFAFRQALPDGLVPALADHARTGREVTLERC